MREVGSIDAKISIILNKLKNNKTNFDTLREDVKKLSELHDKIFEIRNNMLNNIILAGESGIRAKNMKPVIENEEVVEHVYNLHKEPIMKRFEELRYKAIKIRELKNMDKEDKLANAIREEERIQERIRRREAEDNQLYALSDDEENEDEDISVETPRYSMDSSIFTDEEDEAEETRPAENVKMGGSKGLGIYKKLIDRKSTTIKQIKLNKTAKKYLENVLTPLIEKTTIGVNTSRKNSGKGRSQVFGYGNVRQKGFTEFKNNTDYPELYKALLEFGKKVVPSYIPFTAIQVNHNYKTKKHIDGSNVGLSLAVSFGDFTGGELVVNGKAYQTKEHPVIFNGALFEHYNKPIKGNRYSLVYFVSAPVNSSFHEVKAIQNKLFSRIKGSGIEQFSNYEEAQKKTNKYFGKPTKLYISDKPAKKYYVIDNNGKKVYFGANGMEDFTKHKDKKRREAYLKRASNIRGNWKQNKYSPNNLAIGILW